MVRVLKNKFKKKIKKKIKKVPGGGGSLQYTLRTIIRLSKIPIKKKLGRWCKCYEGRLPYPIECAGNKQSPTCIYVEKGKISTIYDRSDCLKCERQVEWKAWKGGMWEKIKQAIAQGEDLTDMPSPNQKER